MGIRRRGRYLKAREEQIAVRRLNRKSTLGYDIIHNSLDAIVTLRIYSAQSTSFELGTSTSEEQYAVNITPPVDDIISSDDVIRFLESFTDEDISNAQENVITVKSIIPGVKITRLNCIEPGGK